MIDALVRDIAQRLCSAGNPDAAQEAGELIRAVLGLSKATFFATHPELTAEQAATIQQYAERRIAGEPLHYIIGFLEFMGMHLVVGPGVLIPRPETELLVEETIKRLSSGKWAVGSRIQESEEWQTCGYNTNTPASLITHHPSLSSGNLSPLTILDLCTGSGCIVLSLARAFPDAQGWGVDISPRALVYARKNAEANAIGNVIFVEGDLFAPFAGQRFACITANPPYVKAADIAHLQVEIRVYEPLNALDGGPDGLDCYRRILAEAPRHLEPGGMLIMELGHDQAPAVTDIALAHGFIDIQCIPDYAGIPRIFAGRLLA